MFFEYPHLLWLLVIPGLLAVLYVLREILGRTPHLRVSTSVPFLAGGHSVMEYIRHLPFLLRTLALVMIVIAIARPRSSEQMEKVDEREVLPFFIDTNQHMNNGKYILLAQQYLKQNEKPKRISVEYRREALLGAALVIKTNRQDNTLTVSIEDKEEKPYAIVQMELEEVM